MEKGSLRVDATSRCGRAGETRQHAHRGQNINSFAFVEKALTVERDRQIALVDRRQRDATDDAVRLAREHGPQRSKEESHDYRSSRSRTCRRSS